MNKTKTKYTYIFIIAALASAVVVVSVFAIKFWSQNKEMVLEKTPKTVIYQPYINQKHFLQNNNPDGHNFTDRKKELIEEEKDFVFVNLEKMEISTYHKGKKEKEFPVLSKGREGSWWETPTGYYPVLSKETNHFSSIGKVWMPWSIQFYGNFFIHGWPYYPDGQEVSENYSGGCIRLSNESAKSIFEFVKRGTPILVADQEEKPLIYQQITPEKSEVKPPKIQTKAAAVLDLDTSEVLLNKNMEMELPVASITKLMTAVVASELIHLGRTVTISSDMLSDKIQSQTFHPGERYTAFDLLYPLLQKSSNAAGKALSALIGEKYFVYQMNKKAESLGMTDTKFTDPSGVNHSNISTLKDISKLMKYISEKRKFIFDITKGKNYEIFGPSEFKNLDNFNEFYEYPNLLGMKNGESQVALQTLTSAWNFNINGQKRNIFIGILGSPDREKDTKEILRWLENNFGIK